VDLTFWRGLVIHRIVHRSSGFGLAMPLLAILILLGSFGAQAGQFGPPSNLAGIWRMEVEPGVHLVSFPLLQEGATVASTLGAELPGGQNFNESTRIFSLEGDDYVSAWLQSNGIWQGNLHQLSREKAYWLVLPDVGDPVVITLVGRTRAAGTDSLGQIEEGMNLVAAPTPYSSTLSASGLVESGLTAHQHAPLAGRVHAWNENHFSVAWASAPSGWVGQLFQLEPEKGYMVWQTPGAETFEWLLPGDGGELDRAPLLEQSLMVPDIANMIRLLPDFTRSPSAGAADMGTGNRRQPQGQR